MLLEGQVASAQIAVEVAMTEHELASPWNDVSSFCQQLVVELVAVGTLRFHCSCGAPREQHLTHGSKHAWSSRRE